ncbi:MAG TPA: FAD-binding oxidoreductase [Candidatus Acidoferrales bacterium]|nr:FAD-binding oxidoreductase [Candidatus Acidoferrales bacterium]
MPFKQTSFWAETVAQPTFGDAQHLPETVDVAVIGAGFTGLSAARTLAKTGARVAVLEAESVGWGASSRNGGMVLTGLKLPEGKLVNKYGLETSRRLYEASLASIDCVARIVNEENIACEFGRSGHLVVANKQAHFDEFKRSAERLAKDFQHDVRIVERSELQNEIGSEIYYGGLVDEASAGLNPAKYVAGLARACERAGAALYEKARVEHIAQAARAGENGFSLTTTRGKLWAHDVFVATSGYTGRATPALRKRIIPIGSYIIVTEQLGEDLARLISPRNRMIYDSKHFLHYFRLTPDRRMLFGGRAAFLPETPNTIRRSAEILRRGMLRVFPQLRHLGVDYAWGGTLDFTFDMLPHAGKIDGLYYAMGYAGHGVAMATYLGTKMAEAMASGRDENPFSNLPFPGAPLGLYYGTPWFLPFVGAWYKLLDWIQ